MHATYRAAILRDDMLNLAEQTQRRRRWSGWPSGTSAPSFRTTPTAWPPNRTASATVCSDTPPDSSATHRASAKPMHGSTARRWGRSVRLEAIAAPCQTGTEIASLIRRRPQGFG